MTKVVNIGNGNVINTGDKATIQTGLKRKLRIYVASSWRNAYQPNVVDDLRNNGFEVYDFRNPSEGKKGFAWSDIDPDWQNWTTGEYARALMHPIAIQGFGNDWTGMQWADLCVLVLPCGRSANAEAGWFAGAGKPVIVYIPEKQEPELMYKMFDVITDDLERLCQHLKRVEEIMHG